MWLLNLSFAAELTFVVVGDTQTAGAEDSINFAVFPQIVEDMNAHDPDVGLFVGFTIEAWHVGVGHVGVGAGVWHSSLKYTILLVKMLLGRLFPDP